MCVNKSGAGGMVKMQGVEVVRMDELKYLGSTSQSNGQSTGEMNQRVPAWSRGWRQVSGAICDRSITAREKGKVYKMVVKPATTYVLETVAVTKRHEKEFEMTELKML